MLSTHQSYWIVKNEISSYLVTSHDNLASKKPSRSSLSQSSLNIHDESMTSHRQTTGRHDDSPTVFFHWQPTHRHDHWPIRQVTDTILKNLKKITDSLTDSYYSWKMNERKPFCQPQNQFIRQSRQKDTKHRNNILFQTSFWSLKLLKENCIQFEDSRSAKLYIKPSSLRFWDYGQWLRSLDVWISFFDKFSRIFPLAHDLSCKCIHWKPIFLFHTEI